MKKNYSLAVKAKALDVLSKLMWNSPEPRRFNDQKICELVRLSFRNRVLATNQCNRELTKREEKELENTKTKIYELCADILIGTSHGISAFGDPRGATVCLQVYNREIYLDI